MANRKLRADLRQLRASLAGCEGFGAMSMVDAAEILNVSKRRLELLISGGELLAMRVAGERMIPRSEIRRELSRRRRKH